MTWVYAIGGSIGWALLVGWAVMHLEHRAARRAIAPPARCNRCRTGSTAFPCTCGTDCYAASCHGWVDDVRRDALRGDGS